jgi:hypothetical protein
MRRDQQLDDMIEDNRQLSVKLSKAQEENAKLLLQISAIQAAWDNALSDGVSITPKSFEKLNQAILGIAEKPKSESIRVCPNCGVLSDGRKCRCGLFTEKRVEPAPKCAHPKKEEVWRCKDCQELL